jgi:choline monooxygenase
MANWLDVASTLVPETLPASLYRGDGQLAREREGVFRTSWLCAGHLSQLASTHAYVALDVVGFPILLVRGDDGSVRGFHNACPHRAGPLAHDGEGTASSFVCRYHGWVFETNGALRSARDFGEPGPPSDCRLFDVRTEVWCGLIFVNIDGTAPKLRDALGGFARAADGFDLEAMIPAGEWHHDLACNWKTYAENYLEGYHIPMVHRELARTIDVPRYEVVAHEDWCLHRAPTKDGTVLDGRWMWRWPNLAVNLYADSMNLEQFVPLDAATTRVTYRYFSRDGTLDEEVSRISKLLLMEDAAICEAVQRNLDAGVYDRGVLSPKHEAGVALFQRLIAEATDSFSATRPRGRGA